MRKPILLSALILGGCLITAEDRELAYDRDHDGYLATQIGGLDCDDNDPKIYPGTSESCIDGVDSDCDGLDCPERTDVLLQEDEAWGWGEPAARLGRDMDLADLDGDGSAELILPESGSPGDTCSTYTLTLPLPAQLSLPDDAAGRFELEQTCELRASSAGDLDGDGDAELAISAEASVATVWIFDRLPPSAATADADATLTVLSSATPLRLGPEDGSPFATDLRFGRVRGLGDRDGDGAGEWLLAAPDDSTVESHQGAVFLLTGLPEAEIDAADFATAIYQGDASDEALTLSVLGSLPDLDGDGITDPLLEASGYWPPELGTDGDRDGAAGGIFGFTGDPSGVHALDDADLRIISLSGTVDVASAARAGDIDGDGYDDIGVRLGTGDGEFTVFRGPISGTVYTNDADVRLMGAIGETQTAEFGLRWTGGVDLDEDGLDDVLVSAPQEGMIGLGAGPDRSGATYLFYGPMQGVNCPDHASQRWVGAVENSLLALTLAHDLTGDGRPDLLMGASEAWPGGEIDYTSGPPGALFLWTGDLGG